jgi:tRNA(Ile)-lysidine synthase
VDLLDRIAAGGLLERDAPVVVLLSGGRDSVCLLDVAARLGRARALHVNYGLRADADADAGHCRSLCARLGVPLEVRRAGPPQGNVQAWARELRYAEGAALAGRDGAMLATGHTATDQAETILYRLASSPSRRALLGMSADSAVGEGAGRRRLVRPLLGVTRAETAAHCRARGLAWVEDPSNDNDAYARGRVRGKLMPALAEIHPAAERNVVRAAQLLREEAAVLDEVVDTALAGRDHLTLDHLRILPPALGRLVVRRLAEDAVGALCPRAASRYEELTELGDRAMLDLGDGARAVVRAGVLRFERTPPLPAGAH